MVKTMHVSVRNYTHEKVMGTKKKDMTLSEWVEELLMRGLETIEDGLFRYWTGYSLDIYKAVGEGSW